MAYFDSPKNRAIWNRELEMLRSEKEYRKTHPEAAKPAHQRAPSAADVIDERGVILRERVSYDILLAEEREARTGKAPRDVGKTPTVEREREKSKPGPSL